MHIIAKLCVTLALVATVAGCHPDAERVQEQTPAPIVVDALPRVRALPVTAPVFLGRLDPDTTHDVPVPDQVEERINHIVQDFYFNVLGGDSAQTFFGLDDVLIRTLVLEDGPLRYYVMILDSPVEVGLQAKVLCADTSLGLRTETFDLNLWAMYHRDGHNLTSGNLQERFLKDVPEIELVDVDGKGARGIRAIRLFHNGTYSAVEEVVLRWGDRDLAVLKSERRTVSPGGGKKVE